ncbi:hypothetical protein WH47_12531 [Habropoda laboriosa]|uniref:Single domain-containing protein n=1 Tax=Habropoda laboriosa TaxID=597456 RepID=A0A0L7R036_9HYME|nr:PREDICTED: uncharacterized protein LOC108573481 [Habropoda laboriosa]KOC64229.1 hypothetical protein WH47_12531 [Habropoda laboriosa]
MKTIILCTLLMTTCLFLEVRGNCQYEGHNLTPGQHHVNCQQITCNPDGTIQGVSCPAWMCGGKSLGYRELDLSKPYPECCPGPICGGTND